MWKNTRLKEDKGNPYGTILSQLTTKHIPSKPNTKGKIPYNATLHWIVNSKKCNLSCTYCITEKKSQDSTIPSINIPALMKTLEKQNKIFNICFSGGGEQFLVPNFIEACEEITKKHYISLFTNLTLKIPEFCEKIDPKKVVYIAASLHIKQLESLGLIDRYINNFLLCKEKGFTMYAIEVAWPDMQKEVKKYEDFFRTKEIEIIFTQFMGKYNGKEYPKSYTKENLRAFSLTKKSKQFYSQQGNICNIGYNVASVNSQGDVRTCLKIKPSSIGSVYKNIGFKDYLIRCPFKTCSCPISIANPYTFEKAYAKKYNAHKKMRRPKIKNMFWLRIKETFLYNLIINLLRKIKKALFFKR